MMKRGRELYPVELANFIVLIIGIIVIGVVLILLIRIQRGLIGIALGALAVGLLVYWLREVRKTIKKEFPIPVIPTVVKWTPDIIERGEEVVVVAKVPGPDDRVKVKFKGGNLEVWGGQDFHETITLLGDLEILHTSYNNGVLQARFRKRVGSEGRTAGQHDNLNSSLRG